MKLPHHYSKLVLHIPHSSTLFPKNTIEEWSNVALLKNEIERWTDYYTDSLFLHNNPSLSNMEAVIFPYSRFYCDAERLANDPMNMQGQGILYTKTNNLAVRKITMQTNLCGLTLYHQHHQALSDAVVEGALLIDCHSFPSDLSDIDICLGYNNDATKPNQETLDFMLHFFEKHNYTVGINIPYSNSMCATTLLQYSSVMIELNKRIYMNEKLLEKSTDFNKVQNMIQELYGQLLNVK